MDINEVILNLEEHSIKPFMQRIKIMEYLMEHHTHPKKILKRSLPVPQLPTLSKTTVYNTLKLFVCQGAALMLTITLSLLSKPWFFHVSHAHFKNGTKVLIMSSL